MNNIFWPWKYTKISILFVLILITVFIILFPYYIIPLPILFWGLFIIFFFFIALNKYTLQWQDISIKLFKRKLFWHSIIYRLIFVGIMYLITFFYDPRNFPFEVAAGDSWYYHSGAQKISESLWNENIIKTGLNYFKSTADLGFPIYNAFVYYFLGSNTIFIRLLNVLFGSLSVLYVYKITVILYDENRGRNAGIIMMLMPPFLWFGGIHIKETLMIFMIITVIYHTIKMVNNKNFNLKGIIIVILLITALYFFRTFLAGLMILSIIIYFFLNLTLSKNKDRVLLLLSFLILISGIYYLSVQTESLPEIINTINQSSGQLETELSASAKQRGISYKTVIVVPFMFIGAIVTPFPSLLDFESRQLGIYIHFFNEVIRNIIYFFAFVGMYNSIRYNYKKTSIIFIFGLGYIFVLAFSGIGFLDRFQLPALPFMIIFISTGLMISNKITRFWIIYLIFIFIAIFSWNYFKLSLRGLV